MAFVHHHTTAVDGLDVFYREAGAGDAPVLLLLHGYPTSSHMFRHLIPALADRYRVIAPDLIGFGRSTSSSTPSTPSRRSRVRSWPPSVSRAIPSTCRTTAHR